MREATRTQTAATSPRAGAFGEHLSRSEVQAYRNLLGGRPATLLDVGADTGKLSLGLADAADRVTCSGFAAPILAVAKAEAARAGVPIRFVVADATNLGFASHSFDAVVSSRLLMHVADWRRALAELLRVARGTVIFDFPPTSSFAVVDVVLERAKRWFVRGTGAPRTIRIADVKEEVERRGWRVVVARKERFLPVALHRKLDDPARSDRLESFCRRLGLCDLFGAPVTFKVVRAVAPRPARVARRTESEPEEVPA